MMRVWFFLLLIFSSTLIYVFAQDQQETETQQEEKQGKSTEKEVVAEVKLISSEYVATYYVFPESPEKEFIIGNPVELLLGLENNGESPINVTQLFASIRHPSDWRYYIQNFTKLSLSVIVRPGEEVSFIYKFKPDQMLEPRTFGLSAEVLYHDFEGGNFSSVFFNNTINLIELSESIDAQTLFTYIGIVGIAGLVLFIIYKSVGDRKRTKRNTPKFETGTQKTDMIDDEWLEGTHAYSKSSKTTKSPTKTRKAKNQ